MVEKSVSARLEENMCYFLLFWKYIVIGLKIFKSNSQISVGRYFGLICISSDGRNICSSSEEPL